MDVYLEVGKKRVFACAVDWPGWSRSGRNEEEAIAALVAYAPRYAKVARTARVKFTAPRLEDVRVVERVKGSATTDFGAPGEMPKGDKDKITPAAAKRINALLKAAWSTFDRVVEHAPATLRKGPRGGGRDRDKIVEHVLGAEDGYARKLGVRAPDRQREALVEAIAEDQSSERWTARAAARRTAWHALDHAWEIEDRTER